MDRWSWDEWMMRLRMDRWRWDEWMNWLRMDRWKCTGWMGLIDEVNVSEWSECINEV